jgi:hypothetical protein
MFGLLREGFEVEDWDGWGWSRGCLKLEDQGEIARCVF